ncbi:MAG TPA: Pr6Pr family membrane protein [Microbacterium sp.]|nr:Pr6Pr family membrane protein [Microbacterium sp.]
MSYAWSALRLLMAAAITAAVVAQFLKSMATAAELGRDVTTTVVNFFSFYTILSNVSAAVVLAWAAIAWFARRRADDDREPPALAVALACVSTYMIVTGVVYNTLLRGIQLPQGSEPIPWSNEILHLVGPVFLLLDVLLAPRSRSLPWRSILVVVAFPIVWVIYTLVRGPFTTNPVTGDPWWYPYPFLDPHLQPWGYGGVTLYIVGIAILIAAVAWFVVGVGRQRAARSGSDQLPSKNAARGR